MAVAQANPPQGLATELWHGLQVSIANPFLFVATFQNNPTNFLSKGSPTFGDYKPRHGNNFWLSTTDSSCASITGACLMLLALTLEHILSKISLFQALDDAGQVVIEEGRVSLASLL